MFLFELLGYFRFEGNSFLDDELFAKFELVMSLCLLIAFLFWSDFAFA
jgi:hypothetical protein